MNTRKYPRTLNEAFPHGAEYGCAIERPTRSGRAFGAVWNFLASVGVLSAFVALCFFAGYFQK